MSNHNSLEIYTSLFLRLHQDVAQCYPPSREHTRDRQKVRRRVKSEGISFLTKRLPALGKAIDIALQGKAPLVSDGFQKLPNTVIPKFLGWLLVRVFTNEGYVRNDVDVTALQQTRQLLYFLYKLKLPYEPELEQKVLDSFILTESEMVDLTIDPSDPVIAEARGLITKVLGSLNPKDIVPRHGPGSVATGEACGEKSNFSRIYTLLDEEYPFCEYFTLGDSQVVDQLQWIENLEVLDTPTAKVVLVPKDSRGPRLISCEPLEIQWIQQGLRALIYERVESHRLTRGFVNFTDQSVNRRLALEGSRTQQYVTLDMKDASDRVSLKLVETLFQGTSLLNALKASRSSATRLPDGTIVQLAKFAPMGSAVCFPIEALCFWAIAVSLLHKHARSYRYATTNVWVYGDDIIVARKDYALLLQYFPSLGLRFNESKCCTDGFFRESCGCDAYKGIDITPTRMSSVWCNRRNAEHLMSYVALSNALWLKGYWGTAALIRTKLEAIYGPLPDIPVPGIRVDHMQPRDPSGSPKDHPTRSDTCIGFYCAHASHQNQTHSSIRTRYNVRLQRMELYVWIVRPKYKTFRVDGWKECCRTLVCGSKGSDLGVYALPRRSCLKRGWRPLT